MNTREPLIVEGPLRECGDGFECSWLTLDGADIRDLLPDVPSLDSDSQCATIDVERRDEPPYQRHVGEVQIHDVPSWELPARRWPQCAYVSHDWGRVRVTIEWLEEEK